jgi:hypothetical protein|tara:strand:- start:1367 stop:1549 length:183 start_codon:yes stop_codon:yes gene_type:complete
MDDITIIDLIKKRLSDKKNQINEILMSGSLKDMEHYKYLQGELSVIYFLEDELRDIGKQL